MGDSNEWVCGTSPTNARSRLALEPVVVGPGGAGVVVEWPSVGLRLYRLDRLSNLTAGASALNLASNLPATPPLNVHTDRTAVGRGPWFYRVGVE
jgi:hypothetical protein